MKEAQGLSYIPFYIQLQLEEAAESRKGNLYGQSLNPKKLVASAIPFGNFILHPSYTLKCI